MLLAAHTCPANVHDWGLFQAMFDAVPAIGNGRAGRSGRRPVELHADYGYDDAWCRRACRARRNKHRIAPVSVKSETRFGVHR